MSRYNTKGMIYVLLALLAIGILNAIEGSPSYLLLALFYIFWILSPYIIGPIWRKIKEWKTK